MGLLQYDLMINDFVGELDSVGELLEVNGGLSCNKTIYKFRFRQIPPTPSYPGRRLPTSFKFSFQKEARRFSSVSPQFPFNVFFHIYINWSVGQMMNIPVRQFFTNSSLSCLIKY